MDNNVWCNECGHSFAMDVKERKYGQGKREVYYTCNHCDHRYTAYITDARVRKWQGQVRVVKDPLRKLELQLKIKQRMDKLKAELNGYV